MTWEHAARELLEADVIEWTEGIWPPTTWRKKKRRPWGKQTVTGQITKADGEYFEILVLRAKVTENNYSFELRAHKVGTTIKKKRQTLLKSEPERLHWSEEEVRSALLAELET